MIAVVMATAVNRIWYPLKGREEAAFTAGLMRIDGVREVGTGTTQGQTVEVEPGAAARVGEAPVVEIWGTLTVERDRMRLTETTG